MRSVMVGLMLIIGCCGSIIVRAGDSPSPDCYIEPSMLRKWIETPPGFPKGSWHPEGSSFVEKEIYRSGDRIALGIIHAYARHDLIDPDRLNRILSIMQLSFSQPAFIVRAEDKNPAVTMLLLFALEHDCKEIQEKEKIKSAERYISLQLTKDNKANDIRERTKVDAGPPAFFPCFQTSGVPA